MSSKHHSADDLIGLANAKARGKRPVFFSDPEVERLLNMLMALVGEVSVMRERIDTIERLLETNGVLRRDDIESFIPDETSANERMLMIQQYLGRILRIIAQEREALSDTALNKTIEDAADEANQ